MNFSKKGYIMLMKEFTLKKSYCEWVFNKKKMLL